MTAAQGVTAPPIHIRAMETLALWEAAALPWALPTLQLAAPRGDGHHVVVIPGFNTGDILTVPLRRHLRSLGYVVHGWGLGRNLGPTQRVVAGMETLVDRFTDVSGSKISLIGWSLGGIYARDLARARPEQIRYVATLGSPFRMREGDRSSASFLAARYAKNFVEAEPTPREEDREPLGMPTSAIYSRGDGLVRPQLCIDTVSALHENIEVYGSHTGLVVNASVLHALGDRLACVADGAEWRPFNPGWPARAHYPAPTSWWRH